MPRTLKPLVIVLGGFVLVGAHATAQDVPSIAPLPVERVNEPVRIVPKVADPSESGMLSTKTPATAKPLPWVKTAPTSPPAATQPSTSLPAAMPFARQAPTGPVIPSAPHSTVAVPVGDVDTVEVSEPAPATPVAPEADPAKEDPAQPTELTSPMFDAAADTGAPRVIVFRVLNKVTAQSGLMTLRPGESVKFGQVDITAEMCRSSLPNSQTDHAGLFAISERLPEQPTTKALFHGWMFASSASIAALEHPVYDVSMVECRISIPAPKPAEKDAKQPAKPAAKKR